MTQITKEIVERARQRAVENPGILIQGAFAADKDGAAVRSCDTEACCFCTLGLIANEAGINTGYFSDAEYELMAEKLGDCSREQRVDEIINLTDDFDNYKGDVIACAPGLAVAGLAGFDYLLSTMNDPLRRLPWGRILSSNQGVRPPGLHSPEERSSFTS